MSDRQANVTRLRQERQAQLSQLSALAAIKQAIGTSPSIEAEELQIRERVAVLDDVIAQFGGAP